MNAFFVLSWLMLCYSLCTPAPDPPIHVAESPGSGDWTTWTTDDGLPENEVRTIFEDSAGRLWFGTRNRGIGVLDDGSWAHYDTDDGLVSNGILSLVEDTVGTIWAAGGGGFSTFDGSVWTPHASLATLQPRVIYSINMDRQGHLWFAANGGAGRFDGNAWRLFTVEDGLPHRVVHAATTDADNSAWFACRAGLAQLVDGAMLIHYPDANFGSIVKDQAGGLWFGTRAHGAYQYDGKEWKQHLPGSDVRPVLVDANGTIWAVSDDAGAYSFDGEEWTQFGTTDGLASETVYDVVQAQDGSMWFATDQGATHYIP